MRPSVSFLAVIFALTLPLGAGAQMAPPVASALDGVYTEEQATRGLRVYEAQCGLCHGPREFAGPVFLLTWGGQRLGSLFNHIRTTMPLDNPGRLTPAQYADVIAYMLKLNDYPVGRKELDPDPEVLNGIVFERKPDPDR
jgi:S-disulfanyl-L-cysteine oxidoreductase SoxD